MGKLTFNRRPFNFHHRTEFIFDGKIAHPDLAQLPLGGNFKTHAVPGDLFPSIQQSPSALTDMVNPLGEHQTLINGLDLSLPNISENSTIALIR